jgi:hypothetical protein
VGQGFELSFFSSAEGLSGSFGTLIKLSGQNKNVLLTKIINK